MMQLEQSRDGRWAIQLGFCEVFFRRKCDAEDYLLRLRERVEAPHVLPITVTSMARK